jgi:hypothetical protein
MHLAATTDHTDCRPLIAAMALAESVRGLAARFEVAQLVEHVADAVRSEDVGSQRFHVCRAEAKLLRLRIALKKQAADERADVHELAGKLARSLNQLTKPTTNAPALLAA